MNYQVKRRIDYLIVGQGLAGSALAWELMQRGRSVVVYDERVRNRASAFAAGIFNPITGKYMTKAWLADTIFPFLETATARGNPLLKFDRCPVYWRVELVVRVRVFDDTHDLTRP